MANRAQQNGSYVLDCSHGITDDISVIGIGIVACFEVTQTIGYSSTCNSIILSYCHLTFTKHIIIQNQTIFISVVMTRYNHINMSSGFIKLILTLVMVMSMSFGSDTTHVVSAFVTPQGRFQQSPMTAKTTQSYTSSAAAWKSSSTTTTRLQERQWNFNEGQGPFGLKKNAETWNGRVAQVCLSSIASYYRVPHIRAKFCFRSFSYFYRRWHFYSSFYKN